MACFCYVGLSIALLTAWQLDIRAEGELGRAGERERKKEREKKHHVISRASTEDGNKGFYDPLLEVAYLHFCPILFTRYQSINPSNTWEERITQRLDPEGGAHWAILGLPTVFIWSSKTLPEEENRGMGPRSASSIFIVSTTHGPSSAHSFFSHFISAHIRSLCFEYIPPLPFAFNSLRLSLKRFSSQFFLFFLLWICKRSQPSIRSLS